MADDEVTGLMPPIIATLLSVLLQGTEAASAVTALIKLTRGIQLDTGDHTALGAAIEMAHKRILSVPRGIPMSIPPIPPAPNPPEPPAS